MEPAGLGKEGKKDLNKPIWSRRWERGNFEESTEREVQGGVHVEGPHRKQV